MTLPVDAPRGGTSSAVSLGPLGALASSLGRSRLGGTTTALSSPVTSRGRRFRPALFVYAEMRSKCNVAACQCSQSSRSALATIPVQPDKGQCVTVPCGNRARSWGGDQQRAQAFGPRVGPPSPPSCPGSPTPAGSTLRHNSDTATVTQRQLEDSEHKHAM